MIDGPGQTPRQMAGTTGAFLVLYDEQYPTEAVAALSERARAPVVSAAPGDDSEALFSSGEIGGFAFEDLGVAVVAAQPGGYESLAALPVQRGPVLVTEPERIVYPAGSGDYLRGFRDGVDHLTALALEGPSPKPSGPGRSTWAHGEETSMTWGLDAIGVASTTATGAGVKVAVLDTGIDLQHPDLIGSLASAASFIPGEEAHDGNGHGTHCSGTIASSASAPRMGVAPGVELHAGKVLADSGRGTDRGILSGIEWALAQGCRIISMSLGAPVGRGQPYSRVFERVATRCLERGTLIVAAAGNESQRPGFVAPVGHPANCPSILAVGAVDDTLSIAPFSCGSDQLPGGHIDVCAPGVDVLSSWPGGGTRRISGTSMATPHVSGVLALYAEQEPGATVQHLLGELGLRCRRLPLASTDVGSGLVQAPD